MKSIISISQNKIEEKWYLVDAANLRLGTIASKVSEILQGKLNPMVRKYHDPKVKVVVINADKIDYTEKRNLSKFYKNYSGYPGGLKFTSLETVMKKDPTFPVVQAVKGMLPRTKMGRMIISNLKVFSGAEHMHEAQKPEKLDLITLKI